jgi:hypothetical protein
MVQRVNGQGLTGIRAGNQVIEIAQTVAGPDSFDDHFRPCDEECIKSF